MTIGMLIESMAGKAGAIHGCFQDSSPFKFHEEQKAIDFVGEQLLAAGYHYYGSEPMYSGIQINDTHYTYLKKKNIYYCNYYNLLIYFD
jgi:DNA-directed RNA polymerase beta subunit